MGFCRHVGVFYGIIKGIIQGVLWEVYRSGLFRVQSLWVWVWIPLRTNVRNVFASFRSEHLLHRIWTYIDATLGVRLSGGWDKCSGGVYERTSGGSICKLQRLQACPKAGLALQAPKQNIKMDAERKQVLIWGFPKFGLPSGVPIIRQGLKYLGVGPPM